MGEEEVAVTALEAVNQSVNVLADGAVLLAVPENAVFSIGDMCGIDPDILHSGRHGSVIIVQVNIGVEAVLDLGHSLVHAALEPRRWVGALMLANQVHAPFHELL